MSNRSKSKGTVGETNVVKFLRTHGFHAKRKALAGSKDEGDIEAWPLEFPDMVFAIEVKAGAQTKAPNRAQIEKWCKQAMVEADNASALPLLVVVRYCRSINDADVYDPISEHERTHMYFEDWALQYQ